MKIINSKLIDLIRSFSAGELRQFKIFISSPIFAKGRNYMPFLEYVLKVITDKDKSQRKEKSAKASADIKLSNQTLRNRYSELYKLGEEFLIFNGLNENKIEKDKILLRKLLEKKLYTSYSIKHKDTVKHLVHEKYDNNKIRNLSQIAEMNSFFLHDKNKIEFLYNEYYKNSELVLCSNLLILFESGLEFAQQEFDNRKYDPNFVFDFLRNLKIDDLMKSFRKSDTVFFKVTSMNYFLYKAFENESNESYYFESHKIFAELFADLKDNFKIRFFIFLINFCIRKQNKGNVKFRHELFKLYNEKLNQNLISDLKNNNYVFNNFRDYVHIGLSIKEFQWVENFIEKYSKELPEEIREDETTLSHAKLYFAKRKFEKSLLRLQNIRTIYYLLYIDSSSLRLCNYYELKKYEEAFLELDRLKHYIRNHNEIPKVHKITIENFIRTYMKLLRIQTDPAKEELGFLGKEVKSLKMISKREWLLEKIGEINN
ncbi:MAG: hypothetical protein IPL53_25195 [Ignavibacteria bacterium]|nr:hypothetical protein [Ignavibacteria bacterium]